MRTTHRYNPKTGNWDPLPLEKEWDGLVFVELPPSGEINTLADAAYLAIQLECMMAHSMMTNDYDQSGRSRREAGF